MSPLKSRSANLWLYLPVVLVMMIVWTNNDFPLDYWLHVNSGRWMLEQRAWITSDTFSHTIQGQHVQNQPWLAQLIMWSLHELAGYQLNQAVAGVMYAVALWLALRLVRRPYQGTLSVWGTLAALLMVSNLGVRPQAFSVVLFVAQLSLLMVERRWWRAAVGSAVLVALWTNLHGAYPLGVVLPVVWSCGQWCDSRRGWRSRRLRVGVAAAVGAAVGVFVRPFPHETISYVWGVSSRAAARRIDEWLPPTLAMPSGQALVLALVAVLLTFAWAQRRQAWRARLVLLVFLLPVVSSQRMILWWGLLLPPTLADVSASVQLPQRLQGWWRSCVARYPWLQAEPADDRWALRCIGGALVGLLLLSTPWTKSYNPCLAAEKRSAELTNEPRGLVVDEPTLREPERLFAPLSWGSYFSWHSQGRWATFVDSRVDFFPDEVWTDYVRACQGGQAALEVLDRHHVTLVVCERSDPALSATLRNSPQWTLSHVDEVAVAYRRRQMIAAPPFRP